MQFHVNPASTKPRSSTSLRKHRGRGDFSGSSSRSHGRRRFYRSVVFGRVVGFRFWAMIEKSELRRNYVKLRSNWITTYNVISSLD